MSECEHSGNAFLDGYAEAINRLEKDPNATDAYKAGLEKEFAKVKEQVLGSGGGAPASCGHGAAHNGRTGQHSGHANAGATGSHAGRTGPGHSGHASAGGTGSHAGRTGPGHSGHVSAGGTASHAGSPSTAGSGSSQLAASIDQIKNLAGPGLDVAQATADQVRGIAEGAGRDVAATIAAAGVNAARAAQARGAGAGERGDSAIRAAQDAARAFRAGGLRAARAVEHAARFGADAAKFTADAATGAANAPGGTAADGATAAEAADRAATGAANAPGGSAALAAKAAQTVSLAARLFGAAVAEVVADIIAVGGVEAGLAAVSTAIEVRDGRGTSTQIEQAVNLVLEATLRAGGFEAAVEAAKACSSVAEAFRKVNGVASQILGGVQFVVSDAQYGTDAVRAVAAAAEIISNRGDGGAQGILNTMRDLSLITKLLNSSTAPVQAVLAAARSGGAKLAQTAAQTLELAAGRNPTGNADVVNAVATSIQAVVRVSNDPAAILINEPGTGNNVTQLVYEVALRDPGAARDLASFTNDISNAKGANPTTVAKSFNIARDIFRLAGEGRGQTAIQAARQAASKVIELGGTADQANEAAEIIRNTAHFASLENLDPTSAATWTAELAGGSTVQAYLSNLTSTARGYISPFPPYLGSQTIVDYTANGRALSPPPDAPAANSGGASLHGGTVVYTADQPPLPQDALENRLSDCLNVLAHDLQIGADRATIEKDTQQLAAVAGQLNKPMLQQVALLIGSGFYGDSSSALLQTLGYAAGDNAGITLKDPLYGANSQLNKDYLDLEVAISSGADTGTIEAKAKQVRDLSGSDHPGLADAATNIINSLADTDGSYNQTKSLTALMNNPPNAAASPPPPASPPPGSPPEHYTPADETNAYQKLLADIKSGADANTIANDAITLAAAATDNGDVGLATAALDIASLATGIHTEVATEDGINSSNELQVLTDNAPGTPAAQQFPTV